MFGPNELDEVVQTNLVALVLLVVVLVMMMLVVLLVIVAVRVHVLPVIGGTRRDGPIAHANQMQLIDPVQQIGDALEEGLNAGLARPAANQTLAMAADHNVEQDPLDRLVDELLVVPRVHAGHLVASGPHGKRVRAGLCCVLRLLVQSRRGCVKVRGAAAAAAARGADHISSSSPAS